MPRIFLSPSTQEYNPYVTGGNEELYANLIADAMEPYLRASGIDFTRNDPNGSVSTSIAASNAGNYDFHLAIHSNAAPANLAGMLQGPDVYYYRDSSRSRAAAEFCARHLGWDTVHCTSGDAMRSIEEIQQEVQQLARKTLG